MAEISTETPEIVIGGRAIPTRYFLAPLAGYTQLEFRLVLRELGGLGLATTDLVQATHLLSKTKKSIDLIETNEADSPLSVQIYSGHTDQLVGAAKWLEDHGHGGVDLNLGCPMAKVNSQGGGARLLCDTENACDLVSQVVDAVQIPVTVKMRLGWDSATITAPELAAEFEKSGVAAITIHGRTREQGFHGVVDLEGIRETVRAVKEVPVIGNGDVTTVDEAFQMREFTGCSAVAIGRGAMLDPWIFKKIERRLAGDAEPFEPSADEQVDFLARHFSFMIAQRGDFACQLFRKFAAWYGAKLGVPEDLEDRLRRFESSAEFDEIISQIRKRHGERASEIPTALMKVPNGPVERW